MIKIIDIVKIKREIHKLPHKNHYDVKVLLVVDSFFGCSDHFIKENLQERILPYEGCEAWKIVMDNVYKNQNS